MTPKRKGFHSIDQIYAFGEAESNQKEKLRAAYVLRYQGDAAKIHLRFVESGISDSPFR